MRSENCPRNPETNSCSGCEQIAYFVTQRFFTEQGYAATDAEALATQTSRNTTRMLEKHVRVTDVDLRVKTDASELYLTCDNRRTIVRDQALVLAGQAVNGVNQNASDPLVIDALVG